MKNMQQNKELSLLILGHEHIDFREPVINSSVLYRRFDNDRRHYQTEVGFIQDEPAFDK